jgi:hypothetical protein
MSDRKETPDVLAEILGGEAAPTPATSQESQIPASTKPRRVASHKPRQRKPKPQAWEYHLVSFQDYKGWRPRYVDGRELADWSSGPFIHEYLAHMGAEGWELTTASSGKRMYGSLDEYQLYFKRPK